MKAATLIAALLLAVAFAASVMAPAATSDTDELSHIAALEVKVDYLQGQADDASDLQDQVAELQMQVSDLSRMARCVHSGVPVTAYKGVGGKRYLAPTRKVHQRHMWVVVMTPGCLKITPKLLGWHW